MKNSVLKYYQLFIVGMWIVFALMIYTQFLHVSAPLEALLFVIAVLMITYPLTTYVSGVVLPKAIEKKEFAFFIVQFILFTLLLSFLYTILIKGFVKLENNEVFPASTMFMGIDRPFYIDFLGNILPAFVPNIVFCATRFFKEHYYVLQEQARLRQTHLEDQLYLLRDQINPHVMFNVLNHIHILLKKDVALADELLLKYSDVLRYQLYECNLEKVPLGKEINYLKDVVEVEKKRWSHELEVNCSWHIENPEKVISPLLLIPFVENAFKHVARLPSQVGFVHIDVSQKRDELTLNVENSKANFTSRMNVSGIGLENVKKRLNILYPDRYELAVKNTEAIYKVTLCINL
ncbi:sensor histidine kinase [Fulvivirga sediminis]|uniref:Histidine kinase n=1 Tax=Fulvivirga sediminis TaxID=2803949 RepID=A0A937F9Q6_9BACT|nr:histidine kinase [Fulvivirga sediminis]MBL3657209.1 histidine kinase [Fulvivirga sediminis]